MATEVLTPDVDLLSQEYVLIQAWKKTAAFIRQHNWYSDTLELDRTTVNLARFIAELSEKLREPEAWKNDSLRIVPAPKSQKWQVVGSRWYPIEGRTTGAKLRPLAHVSLKDQVAATALMLCLADRVETLQGDTRTPLNQMPPHERVVSYGNRLFCDSQRSELHHRWGSSRLYRSYYDDYQRFLERPGAIAENLTGERRVVIVHSDLRQFYDRVRPELLSNKISALKRPTDDKRFFRLADRILNWKWDHKDTREVLTYARQAELQDFSTVALPQGLVAAGFLANIVLLDFDSSLRMAISKRIEPGIQIVDVCRYVDDLRIVLSVQGLESLESIEHIVTKWLQGLLERNATGLLPSNDKTKAATFRSDEGLLVRQSRKMRRIQSAISGGFDAVAGEEILEAVQGLIQSQLRFSEQRQPKDGWTYSPVADVRDATVARFAAARFRTTYRSLRPLLFERGEAAILKDFGARSKTAHRTQEELDDEARAFALGLIENWVNDPSNVRLLRIGLDLWPAEDVLRSVLNILRPFTEVGGRRKAPRRVAWYCLAEIFRAAATETGFVEDGEALPVQIDIDAYRKCLAVEALRLNALPPPTLPWYLKQQILLFLACRTNVTVIDRVGRAIEMKHYRTMIRFLKGENDKLSNSETATLAVLARRAYLDRAASLSRVVPKVTQHVLEHIAERDPTFAVEILSAKPALSANISPEMRASLCLERATDEPDWTSLAQFILLSKMSNPLRNEMEILKFASLFLKHISENTINETIAPSDVLIKVDLPDSNISDLKIRPNELRAAHTIYGVPQWCPHSERWRFQLGFLLRFILTGRHDHTRGVRSNHWKEGMSIYRPPESHWYSRLHGTYHGHSQFGDDWLPITDWTEQLLYSLLRWPGCAFSHACKWVLNGRQTVRIRIERRITYLKKSQGNAQCPLILPLRISRPQGRRSLRPLRACVIQTVVPASDDFKKSDLSLSEPSFRKRHRNHLSAALAAIERMLDLRETHKGQEGRLDWLILPELSVHPRDVKTHLVPFARAHKTIILAGLTYEELFSGKPLVNSAVWIMPHWSQTNGLQMLTRRQGKKHLSPLEDKFNKTGPVLQGFRPCQWLIGYDWSNRVDAPPLWLTAAVCYDATDLKLTSDLCYKSDVFAIPALNKDVNTFDQMALALHYHMFQMVIVANNGTYGGSNAYVPYKEAHIRQVFHIHGQPQASVAFLEIDNIETYLRRRIDSRKHAEHEKRRSPKSALWKFPPAGQ